VPLEHRPGATTIDYEVVSLGLSGDRFINGSAESLIGIGCPQRGPKVGGIVLQA
jgi:hypothetical protein